MYNGEPLADSVDWEMAMGWEATPPHRLHKYELGTNEFSDMSLDEFADTLWLHKPEMPWGNLNNLGTHVYNGEPLADSVDWKMATGWEATPSHRHHKQVGINEFPDMSPIEFAKTHFGYTGQIRHAVTSKTLTHVYMVSHC